MEFSRSSNPFRIQIPAQHDLEPIVQAGEQLGITTIPLSPTDLSCGRSVKYLACRYAAAKMTTVLLHTRDLWSEDPADLRQTVGCVHL